MSIEIYDILYRGQKVIKMIKEYREKKKYTQEMLAELLDISPRQLQRIEQNEEKTKINTLKKIINILDIPDEEIIKYIRKQ